MTSVTTTNGCVVEIERVWHEKSAVYPNGVHVVKIAHIDAKGCKQLFVCDAAAAWRIGFALVECATPPEDPAVCDPELPEVDS